MKTIADIRPPQYVVGMETALVDYSERLARRTGVQASLVEGKSGRTSVPIHTDCSGTPA
jgi:hypothetical protein